MSRGAFIIGGTLSRPAPNVRRRSGIDMGDASGPAAPPAFVGALDAHTTGLVGAWSVARRLLKSWTGALIRVRRGSDGMQADIGFLAGTGMLDVTALLAFCGGGDGFVTRVYVQGGDGEDLLQSETSWQAQIVSEGVLVELTADVPAMVYGQVSGYTAALGQRTPAAISYSFVGVPTLVGGYNGQVGDPGSSFAPNGSILLYSAADTLLRNYTAFGERGNGVAIVPGSAVAAGVSVGPSNVTHYLAGTGGTPGAYVPTFDFKTMSLWYGGTTVSGQGNAGAQVSEMILWTGEQATALAAMGANQAEMFDL